MAFFNDIERRLRKEAGLLLHITGLILLEGGVVSFWSRR